MPLVNAARPKYAPKHRQTRTSTLVRTAPRTFVRHAALLSTAAVAVTGVAVAHGVTGAGSTGSQLSASQDQGQAKSQPRAAALSAAELADRGTVVSRSDSRDRTDEAKEASLAQDSGGAVVRSEQLAAASPREIGQALLPEYGFAADQFPCLDSLYVSESNWRIDADNPTSSAYGIPQALTELHDLPADYATSAESQIRWGLEYIQDSYGSPCSAWSFKQANGWY